MDVFLSVEEDSPMGIYLGAKNGLEVVPLDKFFEDSLVGMSEAQCARYANEFERFALKLRIQRDT